MAIVIEDSRRKCGHFSPALLSGPWKREPCLFTINLTGDRAIRSLEFGDFSYKDHPTNPSYHDSLLIKQLLIII